MNSLEFNSHLHRLIQFLVVNFLYHLTVSHIFNFDFYSKWLQKELKSIFFKHKVIFFYFAVKKVDLVQTDIHLGHSDCQGFVFDKVSLVRKSLVYLDHGRLDQDVSLAVNAVF